MLIRLLMLLLLPLCNTVLLIVVVVVAAFFIAVAVDVAETLQQGFFLKKGRPFHFVNFYHSFNVEQY